MAQQEITRALITITDKRTELLGGRESKLEFRDYEANQWYAIPVKLRSTW